MMQPRRRLGLYNQVLSKLQQEFTIQFSDNFLTRPLVSQVSPEISPQLDLSIEGMRSHEFSAWIFVFLLVGIIVFSGIVIALLYSKNRSEETKLGEKLMFVAIIAGIVVAVIAGAIQMLGGYLF
jgi:hypothetical protein